MKRSLLDDYRIDGEKLLAPDKGVTVGFSDLEADSARDESGFLHRIVARHDMRTWSLSYATLTEEEYLYIVSLLKGKTTFNFEITDKDGNAQSIECYCTKKSASYYCKRLGLYKNLKFEIVEC